MTINNILTIYQLNKEHTESYMGDIVIRRKRRKIIKQITALEKLWKLYKQKYYIFNWE